MYIKVIKIIMTAIVSLENGWQSCQPHTQKKQTELRKIGEIEAKSVQHDCHPFSKLTKFSTYHEHFLS
jgi:hypothetical protein